ncbi:hypothetical protein FRB90_012704, partial [Tulasnella sp. 427]
MGPPRPGGSGRTEQSTSTTAADMSSSSNNDSKRRASTQNEHNQPSKKPRSGGEQPYGIADVLRKYEKWVPRPLNLVVSQLLGGIPYSETALQVVEKPIPLLGFGPQNIGLLKTLDKVRQGLADLYRLVLVTSVRDKKPTRSAIAEQLESEAKVLQPYLPDGELVSALNDMIANASFSETTREILSRPINQLCTPTEPNSDDILKLVNEGRERIAGLYARRNELEEQAEEPEKEEESMEETINPRHGTDLASEQRKYPMAIGRPFETTGPPITIYHPIFSKFQRLCNDHSVPAPEDVVTACKLMQAAADGFPSKADRLDFMRLSIQMFMKKRVIKPEWGFSCVPDGTIFCEAADGWIPLLIMGVNNEVGVDETDPGVKVALEYRKMWIEEKSPCSKVQNVSCCPNFLLSVAGPRITIHGAIFADEFIVQPLTGTLGLANHPNYLRRTEYIAKVMAALRTCLSDLEVYYRDLTLADEPQRAEIAPTFREFTDSDGERATLTYTSGNVLADRVGRAMFDAQMKKWGDDEGGGIPVKVRFTERYGDAAHALLAEKNLAPKLHYHGEVEDGWSVV